MAFLAKISRWISPLIFAGRARPGEEIRGRAAFLWGVAAKNPAGEVVGVSVNGDDSRRVGFAVADGEAVTAALDGADDGDVVVFSAHKGGPRLVLAADDIFAVTAAGVRVSLLNHIHTADGKPTTPPQPEA